MKISENIELIDGTMCNVYVMKYNNKKIQIDAGMKGSFNKIKSYYQENKSKPDIILITHYHLDHIGALKALKNMYSPEIYANEIEIPYIEGKEPIPKPKSFLAKFFFTFAKVNPVEDIKSFKNFNMEGIKFIETYGHTIGSTSIYIENQKFIFVGDAVSTVNGKLSINEKFTLNMEEAKKSLEKIKKLSPITILPGHGNPMKI